MAQGQRTHPTFFVSQPFFMTGVLGFGIEEDEAPIWPKKHLKPRTKSNAAKRVDDVFGSMEGTIIVLREATRGMGAVCILELRSTTRNPFQSLEILASAAARTQQLLLAIWIIARGAVVEWSGSVEELYECIAYRNPLLQLLYYELSVFSGWEANPLGGVFYHHAGAASE